MNAKIERDFVGARENWGGAMAEWVLVHNDDRGLPASSSQEKNRLSADAAALLRLGRRKEALVETWFTKNRRPDLGERIAEAFRRRYAELNDGAGSADQVFGHLQQYRTCARSAVHDTRHRVRARRDPQGRTMIRSVGSDRESFKTLTFGPGLNVILADKSRGASDRQSRNGAGKTSFVELVHFLFGADSQADRDLSIGSSAGLDVHGDRRHGREELLHLPERPKAEPHPRGSWP